jgi:hypothetical protein
MYDYHDAKFVFFWMIKFLIFIDVLNKLILFRDFYWIKNDNSYMLKNFNIDLKKSVFLNLVVKIKLHLDNYEAKKFDKFSLLNFWNVFSRFLKFVVIKSRDFKLKFRRNRITKIKCAEIVKKFENIENEMNAIDFEKKCI